MTTIVLNTKISEFENKIPKTSGLVTTTVLTTKISEVENKIRNHDKYITTPEFNKSTARSEQTNLLTKTDFYNKLTSSNRKSTSNKTIYLEVHKKLNSLITNYYNYFLGRIYLQVTMDIKTRFFINQYLIR